MNGNLSDRQFSIKPISTPAPITPPQSAGHSSVHHTDNRDRPLALGGQTFGSVNAAAAWRRPDRVLPFSAATSGSVFKPYSDA